MLKTISTVSFLIILLTAASAFGQRDYVPQLISEKEMKGALQTAAKELALLSVGDSVTVIIDPSLVMPGDRLDIFEVIKSQKSRKKGDRLVFPVGRLVITEVYPEMVVGELEHAKKEIFAGSYVDFHMPARIHVNRYIDFINTIVTARLDDPINGVIKTALIDVTDEMGSVRRIQEAVYNELRHAICRRPQFSCVSRDEIGKFMRQKGISTSMSMGRYMREKLAEEFGAELYISATAVHDRERVQIILSAYDLEKSLKTKDIEITALSGDYVIPIGMPEDVIVEYNNVRHGYLKMSIDKPEFLSGRKVDFLFTENLDDYIFRKYLDTLGENLSDEVELGRVTVRIDGRVLREGKKRVLFDGIIRAGEYDLKITAIPSLKDNPDVVVGRPIESRAKLKIHPNAPVRTEIILKTYGRQAIIILDTNPIKERSASAFINP